MRKLGVHDDATRAADAELWARTAAGEPAAFEQVFDRHADAIFAFCLRRTGDSTAAEDLMSTTFLHAWRRRTDIQLTSDGPLPWLYGIANNLTRRHFRSVARQRAAVARVPILCHEPDPSEAIAGRLDDARRVERTLEVLRAMSESEQELFVLCVWQGLSYEDAAAALDIPVGTVRSRLSRARSRLRLALGEPAAGGGDTRDEAESGVTGRQVRRDG